MGYILIYMLVYAFNNLIYKQLRLCINSYTKKQLVFLFRNGDLYSIYSFQIKLNLF